MSIINEFIFFIVICDFNFTNDESPTLFNNIVFVFIITFAFHATFGIWKPVRICGVCESTESVNIENIHFEVALDSFEFVLKGGVIEE